MSEEEFTSDDQQSQEKDSGEKKGSDLARQANGTVLEYLSQHGMDTPEAENGTAGRGMIYMQERASQADPSRLHLS